jgi:hypothetical protein
MKKTRKQHAAELLRLIENGPSLGGLCIGPFTHEEAMQRTKLWLATWVLPEVLALVPEARERRAEAEAS